MRKIKASKAFKGSIFATFKDKEAAENFVKSDDAKTYKDTELTRMMQNDYWVKKTADIKEIKAAEKALKQNKKVEALVTSENARSAVHFLKGSVLHVTGLPTENINIALLKEFFGKFGPVAYAAHDDGSSEVC